MSTDTGIEAKLAGFAAAANELQNTLQAHNRRGRLIHALMGLSLWFAGIVTGAAGVLAVHHSEIISTIKENRVAIEALRERLFRERPAMDAGSRSGK